MDVDLLKELELGFDFGCKKKKKKGSTSFCVFGMNLDFFLIISKWECGDWKQVFLDALRVV